MQKDFDVGVLNTYTTKQVQKVLFAKRNFTMIIGYNAKISKYWEQMH